MNELAIAKTFTTRVYNEERRMRLKTKLKRFARRINNRKLVTNMRKSGMSIRDIAKALLGHPSIFKVNNNFLYHPTRDQLIRFKVL